MKYNPYTKNLNTTVFDIETMGLFPQHDIVINAGFCNCDGTGTYQTFLEDPMLEANMLTEILDRFSEYDAVITYNGDRFDLPFILTRAKKYGVCTHLPLFWSIDLYKWIKRYWIPAKQMQHLNQKSVEVAMGLAEQRDDLIGGGECIEAYSRYINLGDETAKHDILLHNGDDVRQLARISEKLTSLPYHEIAFKEGFLVKTEYLKLLNECSILAKGILKVNGHTVKGLMPIAIFEDEYKFEYDILTGKYELEIHPKEKDGRIFVDLNDYPVAIEEFSDLAYSGFLPLDFAGSNRLTKALLKRIFE